MPKRYLVTSGLPYSNGRLHVGHIAGAYLPADTYVRYLRARGHEVLFICGSDDNGVAIELSAVREGITPAEVSGRFHRRQAEDFAGLGIQFDIYGGTHQPTFQALHERFSQDFFLAIYAKGCFTKRVSRQLYDPHNQRFLPDRYVRGTCPLCRNHETYGDQCENTGAVIDPLALINPFSTLPPHARPEVRETAHWYLRLAEFEKPLAAWLESKRDLWRPSVVNFALGQIRQGLPERAMTRDISWGVPVPLDDPDARGKVLYVWFDAPIGYISFTAALLQQRDGDAQAYRRWWCDPDSSIVHFIGEDNTVFHALIWPAMLMAEGRHQLPSYVVANNFVNLGLEKISKSRTPNESPVWIEEYLKRFDPDALRYYLTAIAPESARTNFELPDFVARNNGELVATLGNFVNRTLSLARGVVPSASAAVDSDRALLAEGAAALQRVGACIEAHRFRAGMEELMGFARACNLHIGNRAPWSARKSNPPDADASIATCLHACRFLGVMMWPYMPRAARRLRAMLAEDDGPVRWAAPAAPPAGAALPPPEILFQKLEPNCMDGNVE